jgi:hypothetical protein
MKSAARDGDKAGPRGASASGSAGNVLMAAADSSTAPP